MSKIKKDTRHIGLLAAMPEELGCIKDNLKNVVSTRHGDLEIYSGEWINSSNVKILVESNLLAVT